MTKCVCLTCTGGPIEPNTKPVETYECPNYGCGSVWQACDGSVDSDYVEAELCPDCAKRCERCGTVICTNGSVSIEHCL